jgi:hypothetical protein
LNQALPIGSTMISYHQQPWRYFHSQTGTPDPGFKAQTQCTDPTNNYGPQFDKPHLRSILALYLSSESTMYNWGHSQYLKSD